MRLRAWPLLLILSSTVDAAPLDAQGGETTKWTILLRVSQHPQLGDRFREQLARELKATLQPGLGLLGAVDIVDVAKATMSDETVMQFQRQGLAALESNPLRPFNDRKLHGVTIGVKDGVYEIHSRQLDGFTGLTTPLRSRSVRTLDQIARTVGLMLEPDFAPAGTVEVIPTDPLHVLLAFRGAQLAALDRRVLPGDVFAVSLIKESSKEGLVSRTGTPVPYTFLKVVEPVQGGKAKCLILSRWASPFGRESRRAAGVRALRLPTITTPIRVQLVDRAGKPHRSQLNLSVSDIDFTANGDRFEYRDGVYKSTRPVANIACLAVSIGDQPSQRFPVPLLSDDLITLSFDVSEEAEKRAIFLRDCLDLRARIADLSTAQVAMVAAMNGMIDQAKNREALARAETGRDTVAASAKLLAEEVKTLQTQAGATDGSAKEVLESCQRAIEVVQQSQMQLSSTIAALKDAIGKASDPSKLEKEFRGRELADRIKELLVRGDVPEALAAYDKLIELFPAEPSYKDNREKLLAEWTPKDEAHRVARESLRTLSNAKTVEEFKVASADIKKAIPVMKARQDRLGLRKLHNNFGPAIAELRTTLAKFNGLPATAERSAEMSVLEEVLNDLGQTEILVRITMKELAAEKK